VKKAGEFFVNLLGVKLLRVEEPMPYTLIEVGGKQVAGFWQKSPDEGQIPNAWAVYFAVADCDSAAKKAESLGGKVIVPPTDTPGGRFATLQDPQGAVFGVMKPLRQ
jgi:predicted enzyme related to lactoylglutathione lyase